MGVGQELPTLMYLKLWSAVRIFESMTALWASLRSLGVVDRVISVNVEDQVNTLMTRLVQSPALYGDTSEITEG